VATYHHVRGREAQLKALVELRRVLKSGGEAFITVWNRWQPRFWLKGRELMVPWQSRDGTLYRYYHLFSLGELVKLVKAVGFVILSESGMPGNIYRRGFFPRNVCLLVRKEQA
jgi:SAM-dependent methyltransferase